MRLRPCRRVLGDRTSARWKGTGFIQGRFGGTGHYSISLALIPVQPQMLLVGRSRRSTRCGVGPAHAELRLDRHDQLSFACFARNFRTKPRKSRRARIPTRPRRRDLGVMRWRIDARKRRDAAQDLRKIRANRSKTAKVVFKIVHSSRVIRTICARR